MNNIISKNFFWLIFLFTLPAYTIGVFITEIFVLILIIFFFFNIKNFNLLKDKKFLFLISFSIYLLLNSFFQITYSDLLISSVFHFRFVFLSFAIFFLLKNLVKLKISRFYFKIILLIYIFILIDAIVQFYFGQNLLGQPLYNQYRVSGIFGSELILGSYLIKCLPFIIWLFFFTELDFRNNKYFIIIFLSLYSIAIFLSGERTSLMKLFLMLFLFFIFLKDTRKTIIIIFSILICFISFTGIFKIGKTDPHNRIFVKTFNQFTSQIFTPEKKKTKDLSDNKKVFNNLKKEIVIFSKNHQEHYILGIDMFINSPIFGYGPKGFRSYCRKVNYNSNVGMCTTHPHNILIQFLAETGLIGLFYYMISQIFIIFLLFRFQKKDLPLKEKNCFIAISISILVNFFPFLPSGNFFNNWISIMNYFYIGIFLYSLERVRATDVKLLNDR